MLTARSEDMDEYSALNTEPTINVTKPFNIVELKARIRACAALPQKSASEACRNNRPHHDDAEKRTAKNDGTPVELTARSSTDRAAG